MTLDVAIVGATGAVGEALIGQLQAREFPVARLRLLASSRSAGRRLPFRGVEHPVEVATPAALAGADLVFLAADADTSRALARDAAAGGALVIDNSRAFRMDPDVPLLVPEINPQALAPGHRLVANPNCSTIIALMAIAPLHAAFRVRRFAAATYQAVSGAGTPGLDELDRSTRAVLGGSSGPREVFAREIAFNLIPWIGDHAGEGSTDEELKMLRESRKILGHPALDVTCTCVRVPVARTHSIALTVETEGPVDPAAARAVLARAPGVRLGTAADPEGWTTPAEVAGQGDVAVCRVRRAFADGTSLSLFVLGDQILKGAALNAVQIAELWRSRS